MALARGSRELALKVLPWAVACALLVGLCVLSLDLVQLARHKNFAVDEFGYAHAAYAMAHGQLPYRDFYEFHFPLNYSLLQLLFRFGSQSPDKIISLRYAMLGWGALTLLGAWLCSRRYGTLPALLAPLVLLMVVPLWVWAHEIRNDPPGLALLLLCLGARELRVAARTRSYLAGALCVLCFWSTQKALLYAGAVFVPAIALDWWRGARGEDALLLEEPRAWLVGAGATAGAIVTWLVATRNLGPFLHYCFVQAAHYQSAAKPLSFSEQILPLLDHAAFLLPFALLGVGLTAQRLSRADAPPAVQRDALLLLALTSTFLSCALSQFPYPYSFVPFWGLFGLVAARGALELWPRTTTPAEGVRDVPRLLGAFALPIVLAFCGLRAHALYRERARTNNTYQLSVLAQIDALTASDDAFFDCSGSFVSRPHSYYYFVVDGLMRNEIPDLANDALAALTRAQTVAVMPDLRYGGLPANLRFFIESHYQKYSGDLWLYGQVFDAERAHGGVAFTAIKAGRYFVNGSLTELSVDGKPVNPREFWLTRGSHQLTFGHANGTLQVLWLPKNGEHWRPHTEARPSFSVLFG